MDLGGRLSVIEPAMIFQFLHTCSLSGFLKFIASGRIAEFYLKSGDVIFATLDRRKRIGDYLLDKQVVTRSQLKKSLKAFQQENGRIRIGEILIKQGYIEREVLVCALREQMKEAVYEVLKWNEGDFVFFKNLAPEDQDIFLDQRMDLLILEGYRRLDEQRC